MKSVKNLLIPLIILAVLVIGLVLCFVFKPNDAVPSVSQDSYPVLSLDVIDVASITVDKQDGSTLTINSTVVSNTSVHYELVSDDTVDNVFYSQDIMASYVSMLSTYISPYYVSDGVDFAEYGLDNPLYTVTITMVDGTTHVALFGNPTSDGKYNYFALQGQTQVYMMAVAKSEYCEYNAINFRDTQILNLQLSQIQTATFDRTTDGVHLETTCVLPEGNLPTQFYVTEPYSIQASTYFKNLLETVTTLTISSFVDISQEQLADYGLDEPTFSFNFRLRTGESISVYFSSNIGGVYYGFSSLGSGYFSVSESLVSGFETPLLTLLSTNIYSTNEGDVSSISCQYGSQQFEFDVDVVESITEVDGDVTLDTRNPLIYSSNGACYASVLFDALNSIQIGGVDSDANPSGTSEISLNFILDDYSTTTLEFITRDSSSYYVMINGEYSQFYVNSDEIFANGGADGSAYGFWAAYELVNEAIDGNINGVYDVSEA